jgi:hypothetical protein
MQRRKITQVKHTHNTLCFLEVSEVITMQCNNTEFKGKSQLTDKLITIVEQAKNLFVVYENL